MFHLLIPAGSGPAEEPEEEAQPDTGELPGSLRVLIVDDNDAVATGLRWSIEAAGLEARVVGTGAEVVPVMNEWHPDIVVLDLSLPDEDGRTGLPANRRSIRRPGRVLERPRLRCGPPRASGDASHQISHEAVRDERSPERDPRAGRESS